MNQKLLALVLLAVVSFASPLVEMLATGRLQDLSNFDLADLALSVGLLFWWYHLDRTEHRYAAGPLMNAGIIVAAVIAFPIYFVRTRGWRRGAVAIAVAAAFGLLLWYLAEAGEWLGARLAG